LLEFIPGLRRIGNSVGRVRLGAVKFWGGNRGCPRFIGNIDFLIALPSAQDWLLCARHLFVAAMVAWVHPGCRESAIQRLHFEPTARMGQKRVIERRSPLLDYERQEVSPSS
jgi:hypothetical protein